MPTIRGLALGVTMVAAGLLSVPATALAAPSDLSGEGSIAVETEVTPAVPLPGEPIVQTARVINTGSRLLTRIVVQLDAGPACRWVLPVLTSGQKITLTCADIADSASTVVKARARGATEFGRVVHATAGVRIDFALPAREPVAAPPAPPAPSAVPAAPPPATPVVPVVPLAPVAAPAPAPAAVPPPSAPAAAVLVAAIEPTVQTVGRTGPLASPARTAGVIAIVTVMVMTAAVGALGGAVRVR